MCGGQKSRSLPIAGAPRMAGAATREGAACLTDPYVGMAIRLLQPCFSQTFRRERCDCANALTAVSALPPHHLGDRYHDTGRQYGGQIKSGWSGACHCAGLPGHVREWVPRGQKTARRFFVPDHMPHSLRHTWATWHYCAHRDLLKLQLDGDWSEIRAGHRLCQTDAYRDEIIGGGHLPHPTRHGLKPLYRLCHGNQGTGIESGGTHANARTGT